MQIPAIQMRPNRCSTSRLSYLAWFLVFLQIPSMPALFAATDDDSLWCEYLPSVEPADVGKAKHVVLISGDDEYRSEEFMPMLGQILAVHHGFRVTVLFPVNPETGMIQPSYQKNIPGMHRLDDADLVVLALRFRQLPDEQMKHFVDYFESGKPLIGIRTSTHAFNYPANSTSNYKHYSYNNGQDWPGGFGKQVFGETWVNHHGRHKVESTRGVIEDALANHPILTAVQDVWGDTDVYGIRELPVGTEILMRGQILTGMRPDDPAVEDSRNQPMMPIAWTRNHQHANGTQARIFCTTMGAATDFENEGLRRLLVNACYWGLQMEDKIPQRSVVDYVLPYQPTPYGFGTERDDLTPASFRYPPQ